MEELFQKLQRKQEAAAKFDCERRREAAAKEEAARVKEAERQSALEERKKAEMHRSAELSAKLESRLEGAAARRQQCLDMIMERTAPSSGAGCAPSAYDALLAHDLPRACKRAHAFVACRTEVDCMTSRQIDCSLPVPVYASLAASAIKCNARVQEPSTPGCACSNARPCCSRCTASTCAAYRSGCSAAAGARPKPC